MVDIRLSTQERAECAGGPCVLCLPCFCSYVVWSNFCLYRYRYTVHRNVTLSTAKMANFVPFGREFNSSPCTRSACVILF